MIAGVQYRKVYTDYYRQDYPIYIGAAREEVQTGKLWWRANRANYDYLLVDMSLNKGDFFCDYPVDTVYYDSAGRKIVTLGDDYDPDHQIHFIEGVGADRNQLIDNFTNSPCDNLICVFHDNIRVFQTTLFDSTWVDFNTCRVIRDNLSIHSLQRKKCLELYPNPFTDNTEIEYYVPANVTSAEIYIFSLSGLLLQTYPLSDFGHGYVTVSGSSLEAGMYVYALVVDGRIVDSKRMILTR